MHYFQYVLPFFQWNLLCISGVCYWLIFIIFKAYMSENAIWNIFNVNPFDGKLSLESGVFPATDVCV